MSTQVQTCTICNERPAMESKTGKLGESCVECVQAIVAAGGCGICRAENVSQEHRDTCLQRRGKPQRKAKSDPTKPKGRSFVNGKEVKKPPSQDKWVPDLI